jgi:hypothetical protein
MIKPMLGALASVALIAASGTAAFACGGAKAPATSSSNQTSNLEQSTTAPVVVGEEEMMDEVAGVRIVPSVIAKDIALTPSAWILKDPASRMATANAKVYTNAQNEITGLTITSWGLPDPERINGRFTNYVVWLVDVDTNQMLNIGTLESKNGGQAVFGHTPQMPLRGYDRIVITPETSIATSWPSGWQQLTADIPMAAMVPMDERSAPMTP